MGKLAPAGWHIPSDAEWDTLAAYVGGAEVAGGKLKEAGTTHWASPNTGATNEASFSALPGGCRYNEGYFHGQSDDGYWWSATEDDLSNAWYRGLRYSYSDLFRSNYDKKCGFSVRLLRDY